MLFALAFLVALLALLQVDSTTANQTGPLGFFVGYVLSNIVPLITAWIVKRYNTSLTWYAKQNNIVKMAVYVGVTLVFMYGFKLIGLGWDETFDPEGLTPEFIQSVVQALISTLLVKVGIRTEQQRTYKSDSAVEGRLHG